MTSLDTIGIAKFRVISGPTGGYSNEVKNLNEPICLSLTGDYVIEMFLDTMYYEGNPCGPEVHYDTIHNDGGAVQKDYAWALMCNDGTGDVFVKGKNGTEPYTYILNGDANMLGADIDMNTSGVFNSVSMNYGGYLSCMIIDSCGETLTIDTIRPEFFSNVPQAQFENASTSASLCERDFLRAINNEIGNLYGYIWDGPNGFHAITSDSAMEIPLNAANGWYKVSLNIDCPSITSDSIYLTMLRVPLMTIVGSDSVCPHEDVILSFTPISINPSDTIKFTIAFSNTNGVRTRNYEAIPGTTVFDTLELYENTKIYPVYINDGFCHNTEAEPSDTLHVHLKPVASSDHIFTTDQNVCYNSDTHLEAWSDYEEPYTIRWYEDFTQTNLLKEELVSADGAHSTFDTTGITQGFTLYLALDKEGYCPTPLCKHQKQRPSPSTQRRKKAGKILTNWV